ncbi:uncharacterized protein FMAN_09967 [Fusarium mangiferae]|uniref:Uncharacterized protein n=1 Tax=Fusarium mangiferae TaxID=192010 RepID=A0A1L7TPI3_FUSMA|nr:uncharacterized protein FMAN_09967 [Fusarium mangiferae]CVL00568.1 uncharacterized protein FMAN_09967 [Fusarium mangiferae]
MSDTCTDNTTELFPPLTIARGITSQSHPWRSTFASQNVPSATRAIVKNRFLDL